MNQAQPRTQADDFNRLIAVAFEEKVNAQAYAAQLEQKLALAGAALEAERAKVKELQEKVKELTPPPVVDIAG